MLVTLHTILKFQFGNTMAIHDVARNHCSVHIGCLLVLITAVPRNYDQSYLFSSPFWLFGPLLFSFFSRTFLFICLYYRFIRPNLDEGTVRPSTGSQWVSFMSLFWMTAPVAWLYAIPV